MTWDVVLWLSSAVGAVLFFAAGRLTSRPAAAVRRDAAVPAETPPEAVTAAWAATTEALAAAPAAAPASTVTVGREEGALRLEVERLHREIAASRAEGRRLVEKKSGAETEVERLRVALATAEKQNAGIRSEAMRLEEQLRTQILATKRDDDLLVQRARGLAALETQLEGKRQELQRWQEQLSESISEPSDGFRTSRDGLGPAKLDLPRRESETRPGVAAKAEADQTLRQDLTVKTEQLRTLGAALRRLEAENAGLRQEIAAQESREGEIEQLRADNASLRAQVFASRPGARTKALDLNAVEGVSRGTVLQTLVERVSRLGDIRCAVVADDLGLVVASHGELGDEVAAVGALFSRAGLQAQQVLPLQNVERVTVEDSQGVVLALRPLRTERRGDPELTLITLAVGAGPDQRQVNKLIDEGPRLALLP